MTSSATALLSLAALAAAVGCRSSSRSELIDRDDRPSLAVHSEEPRGGGPLSVAGALSLLAEARCDREASCGMLGENRSKVDREGCERDALKTHAGDVAVLACKGTVDAKKVAACADKLRAFTCNRDALDARTLCGAAKLCVKD